MRRWNLLAALVSHVRLTARLLREPTIPLVIKTLPFLAAGYVIFPLDFVPDMIPVLGQLDDLGVILIALEGFIAMCPDAVVTFHKTALAEGRKYAPMPKTSEHGEIIDAEFRRENSER
jgi:uncharacterized membrane protein YkvA (DUF1232 family)